MLFSEWIKAKKPRNMRSHKKRLYNKALNESYSALEKELFAWEKEEIQKQIEIENDLIEIESAKSIEIERQTKFNNIRKLMKMCLSPKET